MDQLLTRFADEAARRVVAEQRIRDDEVHRALERIEATNRDLEAELASIGARLPPVGRSRTRPLVLALLLVLVTALSIVVGHLIVPAERAVILIPSEVPIDDFRVTGFPPTATVKAEASADGVLISGAPRGVPRQAHVAMTVSAAACPDLAQQIGGRCGGRSDVEVEHGQLQIESDDRLSLSWTAEHVDLATLNGSNEALSVGIDARDIELKVGCDTSERLSLSVDGASHTLTRACAEEPTETLWLRLAIRGGLPVTLTPTRSMRMDLPGRNAAVSTTDATASVGSDDTSIRNVEAVKISLRSADPDTGFTLDAGTDQSVTELTVASARSVSSPRAGERVDTLLERWQEGWVLFAGAVLGLVFTLLTEAYLGKRP